MDVFDAVQRRFSVRTYLPDPVPKDKLERILEAARLAPSAGNVQPWHFIVVTDKQTREQLSESGLSAKFLTEAPIVIVGCGNKKASPKWHIVDTTIALQSMVLVATGEGLGTCWIGSFAEEEVKKLLNIPREFGVVALLTVGYPREKSEPASKTARVLHRRKKLEEIASLEEFGNPFTQQP